MGAAGGGSRWTDDPSVPRGAAYDNRFEQLAASGADVHGEATLLADLAPGRRILDAGCGTGRVAIELDRRGFDVVGVDLDGPMLDAARDKAPALRWIQSDLAAPTFRDDLANVEPAPFDVVALAGNVLIFVAPGTEAQAVANCASVLAPTGVLVAGFSVRRGGYGPDALDADAARAGLVLRHRWSTWDRAPWTPTDDYQVSVHARPAPAAG